MKFDDIYPGQILSCAFDIDRFQVHKVCLNCFIVYDLKKGEYWKLADDMACFFFDSS